MTISRRSSYWDNWKGLAVIAVVAIHASDLTRLFPEGSLNWIFGLGFRQVVNFAVPMFLALSGYFSVSAKGKGAIDFYKDRLPRILLPYAFWTILSLARTSPLTPPSLDEVIRAFLFGEGIWIGYFVIVLLQYILITPLLMRIQSMRIHLTIICILTVAGLALSYYTRVQSIGFFGEFPGSALPFIFWYPFYHFGLLMRLRSVNSNSQSLKSNVLKLWMVFFAALFFSFLEGLFWGFEGFYSLGASQIKVSSFAASLALASIAIIGFKAETFLRNPSALTFLGRNSYAIYLIHLNLLTVTRKIVDLVPGIYEIQPLYIALLMVFTILFCALFIGVFRKIASDRVSAVVLG